MNDFFRFKVYNFLLLFDVKTVAITVTEMASKILSLLLEDLKKAGFIIEEV